jgi:hypothetical protein
MNKRPRNYSPIVIASLIGIGAECCFLFLSFVTAFGICSDTAMAESLFPYALAWDPTLRDHLGLAFFLALIQWPIYGVLLGVAWMKGRSQRSLLILSFIVVFAVHLIAVAVAKNRVNNMWETRFSNISVVDLK